MCVIIYRHLREVMKHLGQRAVIHLSVEAKSSEADIYYLTEKRVLIALMPGSIWSEEESVDLLMPFTRLLTFSYWSVINKVELIWLPFNGMNIFPMYLKREMLLLVPGPLHMGRKSLPSLPLSLKISRHFICQAFFGSPLFLYVFCLCHELSQYTLLPYQNI